MILRAIVFLLLLGLVAGCSAPIIPISHHTPWTQKTPVGDVAMEHTYDPTTASLITVMGKWKGEQYGTENAIGYISDGKKNYTAQLLYGRYIGYFGPTDLSMDIDYGQFFEFVNDPSPRGNHIYDAAEIGKQFVILSNANGEISTIYTLDEASHDCATRNIVTSPAGQIVWWVNGSIKITVQDYCHSSAQGDGMVLYRGRWYGVKARSYYADELGYMSDPNYTWYDGNYTIGYGGGGGVNNSYTGTKLEDMPAPGPGTPYISVPVPEYYDQTGWWSYISWDAPNAVKLDMNSTFIVHVTQGWIDRVYTIEDASNITDLKSVAGMGT